MSNIVKEMNNKFPKTLFRNYIFLSADVTKPTNNCCSTIQAIFLFALRCVAHNKFLLKISTKIQAVISFPLLNNSIIFDPVNIICLHEKYICDSFYLG